LRHPLAFIVASGGVHVIAFGVASAVGAPLPVTTSEPAYVVMIEPELAALPEPVVEPVVEPEPEPAPPPPPVRVRRAPPPPADVPAPAEPAPVEAAPVDAAPGAQPMAITTTTSGAGLSVSVSSARDGSATGPSTAAATERSSGTEDARSALREWIARVRRTILARAARDYPRAAIRARTQGTVTVAFAVASDGRIASISVARPSESELLDRAAIRAVEAVERLPPPPDAFRAHGRPLTIPITYRLD
jgi:protein TonB